MRKSILYRMLFYALGLLSLALGLTLNTKTGLGASAIISVAYSFSEIFERNFGNVTLALYVVFVAAQMALHLMRAARYAKAEEGALAHAGRRDIKLVLLMDVLQISLEHCIYPLPECVFCPDTGAVHRGGSGGERIFRSAWPP